MGFLPQVEVEGTKGLGLALLGINFFIYTAFPIISNFQSHLLFNGVYTLITFYYLLTFILRFQSFPSKELPSIALHFILYGKFVFVNLSFVIIWPNA